MIRDESYQRHIVAMFIFIRIKPCENLYMKCVMYFINILKCRHLSAHTSYTSHSCTYTPITFL